MKTIAAHMRCQLFLAAIFVGLLSFAGAAELIYTPVLTKDFFKNSRQMVLVTTENWEKVSGTLQRFERSDLAAEWRAASSPIKIVVGRNGLGWGRGLHEEIKTEPQKKEGDGKSPAGIFRLSSAFGFAPPDEMKLKVRYLHVTDALECIDDINSVRYNSLVDNTHIFNSDWKSSEKMLAVGEQYRLGVVVEHNTDPRTSGKGSCIFLHIWKGDGSGTSGCTAMEKSEMEKLILWLDARANPVLVQLPEDEFLRVQSKWNLPSLKINSAREK